MAGAASGRRVYERERAKAERKIREALETAGPVVGELVAAKLYAVPGICGCCDARRELAARGRIADQRARRARLKQEAERPSNEGSVAGDGG